VDITGISQLPLRPVLRQRRARDRIDLHADCGAEARSFQPEIKPTCAGE
jgi:hypothetical protein